MTLRELRKLHVTCPIKFNTGTGIQIVNMDWVRSADSWRPGETSLDLGETSIEVKHSLKEVYEMWEKALKDRLILLRQQETEVVL